MSDSLSIAFELSSSFGQFNKKIDRALSVHGISFTEFMVMHQLAQAPNKVISRIQLADAINLTASGVTRLLLPMEKNGLVEKEKNSRDARVSLVKLTDTGNTLYQDALATSQSCSDGLTQHLSSKQLTQLSELLRKLG
ncbi:MarR family winged helix-turn-helix transcriptional regulator [Shewanella donghaensis]|uniref:MarR family winged helix-turn-helix transcriptional regulator n=1 Tax=Shewanella donghaensis TaxID=238836 RepID=UPI0011841FA0|nr:MarR family transcriptional regulator [Shewanella donghaensis]